MPGGGISRDPGGEESPGPGFTRFPGGAKGRLGAERDARHGDRRPGGWSRGTSLFYLDRKDLGLYSNHLTYTWKSPSIHPKLDCKSVDGWVG